VHQKYSENYFHVGIIAVEISRAGPATTVFFFLYFDICWAIAASSATVMGGAGGVGTAREG